MGKCRLLGKQVKTCFYKNGKKLSIEIDNDLSFKYDKDSGFYFISFSGSKVSSDLNDLFINKSIFDIEVFFKHFNDDNEIHNYRNCKVVDYGYKCNDALDEIEESAKIIAQRVT